MDVEYDMTTQRIYEFGNAHGGDTETFREMVATIVEYDPAGMIKIQIFDMDLLDPYNESDGAVASRKAQVTPHLLTEFRAICDEYGMSLGASVFQAELLDSRIRYKSLDFLKVPSPEFCDSRKALGTLVTLIDRSVEYDIPLYASTGMSSLRDIVDAMKTHAYRINGNAFTLMHCVSEYPPKNIQAHRMRAVEVIAAITGCRFGFSDHDPSFNSVDIVPMSVSAIEKHVQLSPGHELYQQHPDGAVSFDLNEENITKFIETCPKSVSFRQRRDKNIEHPAIRVWVTTRQIGQGDHLVQGKNVIARRVTYGCEKSISSNFDIQTQKAVYNIPANATLERSMLLPISR